MTPQQQTNPAIPGFYRIFFTWVDPVIALFGAYMSIATPAAMLNAYIPAALSAYDPQQAMIFQQLGGSLLGTAFTSAVLLRYAAGDVGVWRLVQASILIVDAVLGYSIWDGLRSQGRLSLAGMRFEDWGDVVLTGGVALVRTLFLLRVGFPRAEDRVKRA